MAVASLFNKETALRGKKKTLIAGFLKVGIKKETDKRREINARQVIILFLLKVNTPFFQTRISANYTI